MMVLIIAYYHTIYSISIILTTFFASLYFIIFQTNDDDDIGALGSILSWDEDEEGVGGGSTPQGSTTGATSSNLPDLVSFNSKDGTVNTAYLQQLLGAESSSRSGNDTSNLTIPMPTPVTFHRPTQAQSEASQATRPQDSTPSTKNENVPLHQLQAQTPQLPNGQKQPRGQSEPQAINSAVATNQAQAEENASPTANTVTQQQQQQLLAAAVSAQQQGQHASTSQPQHGAFALFQPGAVLAQQPQATKQAPLSIRPALPAVVVQGSSQSSQDNLSDPQRAQFAFTADPNAFLRQLQVAQLQQQFNAVQQQAQTTNAAQLQQQMSQFQQPQPSAAAAIASSVAPTTAAAASSLGLGPGPGKSCASGKKATGKPRKTPAKLADPVLSKNPIVSASDTDGELSTKAGTVSSTERGKRSSLSLKSMPKQEPIDFSNMTPEEKATANRDRNREHARNTRLRKKAYLEKLKATVDELCRERDTLVSERAGAANILVEMHNTRTEVLMSFFALRSANEKRRDLWASILDESCFACVVPVTPYRSFPASEVQVSKCQRTILGIDGMMADTASLHVLLNSLVDRARFPNATIQFRYTLVTEEAVVAGNQMMARWVMTTLNATQCGARMEIAKQGMLCCKFNSAHKIIGLELMFDVMALMLQLKQAAGSDTFSVIPNTVQTCQRTFDMPMAMTLADEPYTIVQVNKLWEEMTGYKAEEVVGKSSLRSIEGEETDVAAVEALMNEIRYKRPASAMVVNYKKSGERFRNFFMAFPLSTDSRITHYLHLSSHMDSVTGAPAQPNQSKNQLSNRFSARKNAALSSSSSSVPPVLTGSNLPNTSNGPSDPTPQLPAHGHNLKRVSEEEPGPGQLKKKQRDD